jgi:hypothetical protein
MYVCMCVYVCISICVYMQQEYAYVTNYLPLTLKLPATPMALEPRKFPSPMAMGKEEPLEPMWYVVCGYVGMWVCGCGHQREGGFNW